MLQLYFITTGGMKNQFKFIYLFFVIRCTIEVGKSAGTGVALFSSATILIMDLIMDRNSKINIYFENDIILVALLILTAWLLGYYVNLEKEHKDYLQNLANKDGVTGAYNHRFFYSYLHDEKLWDRNQHNTISMMFIDIDDFKKYNDLFGHLNGDDILKNVSTILIDEVGDNGIVSRYGGDEFAVILPDICENEAVVIAERIIDKTAAIHIDDDSVGSKITVSIGISVYPDRAANEQELIKSADDALYRAKIFNKNRIETYTSVLDGIMKNVDGNDEEIVGSIKTLISIINSRDRYTYGHVERVVFYSKILANYLELDESHKKVLVEGAYMHDIGKINIDKDVLMKKMKLTDDEWLQLKSHPGEGVAIIESVKSLADVVPIILYHHERYDGRGYPCGLKGDEIPYLARILTVVDSFDAMTSSRPYNDKKTFEEAFEEIRKCSGSQFDPVIAEKFIEIMSENYLK